MRAVRHRKITLVLLALTAADAFWALLLVIRLHPAKLRLVDLETKSESLRIEVGQLEAEARRVDTARREAAGVAAHKAPASRSSALSRPDLKKSQQNLIQLIHDHPQVEEKYLIAEKAALGVLYHPLFRALNLTADQQAQVLAVLGVRAQSLLDTEATAFQAGGTVSDPAVVAEIARQNLAAESALQNLIGIDGYRQFQDYETTVNIRLVVGNLASYTYYDHPLTADQSDRLVAALGGAVPATAPIDPLLADRGPPGTDWDAATGAAADVLDPEQLATFRTLAALNKEGRMN